MDKHSLIVYCLIIDLCYFYSTIFEMSIMQKEIKVVIESDRISALELAKILDSLGKSFKVFVNRTGGRSLGAQLAVVAIHRGSIEVVLDAIASADKLIDACQYLAPFATHLAQITGYFVGSSSEKNSIPIAPADRKAIEALAHPVANGNASQINIVNNGSIVVSIGSIEDATSIINALKSKKQDVNLSEYIEDALMDDLNPKIPTISRTQVFDLRHGRLFGTAFLVENTWYARLEGGQGVLVPISAHKDIYSILIAGHAYAFRGRPMTGARGETIGIFVEKAIELG